MLHILHNSVVSYSQTKHHHIHHHQCHLNHHQHHHPLTLCESSYWPFSVHVSSFDSAGEKKRKKWLLRTLKSSWLGHYFLWLWQLPVWSISLQQAKHVAAKDTHTRGDGGSVCMYVYVGVRVQSRSRQSSSRLSLQPHESNVSDFFLFFFSTVCSCVVGCPAAKVKWAESF